MMVRRVLLAGVIVIAAGALSSPSRDLSSAEAENAICRLVSLRSLPNPSRDLELVLGIHTWRYGYRLDQPAHVVSFEFVRRREGKEPLSYGISVSGPMTPVAGLPDTALSGEVVIHAIDPETFQPNDLPDGKFRIIADVKDGLWDSEDGVYARNAAKTTRTFALDDFHYQNGRVFTHFKSPAHGPTDKLVVHFFRPDRPEVWVADEAIEKNAITLNVRFRP